MMSSKVRILILLTRMWNMDDKRSIRRFGFGGCCFFFWLGKSKGLSSAEGSRGRRFERAKTCQGSCNNTTSDGPTLDRAFLESTPRLLVCENSGRALGGIAASSLGRTPATSRSHSQRLFVMLQRSVESSSFQKMAAG